MANKNTDLQEKRDKKRAEIKAKKEAEKELSAPERRKKRTKRTIITLASVIGGLAIIYCIVAFTDIPVIKRLRTLWIETAMTTTDNKWLATAFFPGYIIDDVMNVYKENLKAQEDMSSTWEDVDIVEPEPVEEIVEEIEDKKTPEELAQEAADRFYERYSELDTPEFKKYLAEKNPVDLLDVYYNNLVIEDLNHELGLYTAQGDDILVVNVPNNLVIVGVHGSTYVGKMAIVKDPAQVIQAKSSSWGYQGSQMATHCSDNDAILGVNASRFPDPNGHGSGAGIFGSFIIDGVEYNEHSDTYGMKFCGMTKDNKFIIDNYSNIKAEDYRWGLECLPALVINGEDVVDGSFGMGIQPRTAIGQAKNGDMLLLVIDGRQPGYSLGCSVDMCADVLLRYDCYQGHNMDGGSSSVMYYDGNYITRASSVSGVGRYTPNAICVKRIR